MAIIFAFLQTHVSIIVSDENPKRENQIVMGMKKFAPNLLQVG
jgi:hypothetical protein